MEVRVTDYLNYREYLKDWVDNKKVTNPRFSFRQFAKKAELSSPNYFQRVIGQNIKLTDEMIEKFLVGLSLKEQEAEYFRNLVKFNQSQAVKQKVHYLQLLERVSKFSKAKELQQINLKKNWYYVVVWELASCLNFKLTPENVFLALNGKISKKEAKDAIDFLIEGGFLKATEEAGVYQQTNIRIMTTDEVDDCYIKLAHKQFAQMAIENSERPVAQKEYQGLTIALSKEKFELAKKKIKQFSMELLNDLANDSQASRVYRINFQLFSVTDEVTKQTKE